MALSHPMLHKSRENRDKILRRIDYVLMDRRLGCSYCLSASMPRNKVTDAISDDYPIIVTLQLDET